MWMGRGGCEGVRGGLCFMCGTIMQINDLLQCRAEQHNACTPVHHSTSPVPPLQAGWKKKEKNHFSSQSRDWKQGRGATEVCLEAQTFTFLFLADKTMLLELRLLNWEEGDWCFWVWPQLHWHTIWTKVSFHQERQGKRKEKLTISSVSLCTGSL